MAGWYGSAARPNAYPFWPLSCDLLDVVTTRDLTFLVIEGTDDCEATFVLRAGPKHVAQLNPARKCWVPLSPA